MKILLAQINTIVGALEHNTRTVIETIRKARAQSCDLVVFPELTLTGYPPKDLVEKKWFVEKNGQQLEAIAHETEGIGAIVGHLAPNPSTEGKGVFNSAALLCDKSISSVHYKSLLPTYDVFDEARYFDPAPCVAPVLFRGKRLGISICEDIWNDQLYWDRRLYKRDPILELAEQGVDLMINISASPFTLNKRQIKHDMFSQVARRHQVPLVHTNLVGGNDSLIFDGWSNVFSAQGEIIAQARDFHEDLLLWDTDQTSGERHPVTVSSMQRLHQALCLGLRDYVKKCGFQRVVIGLSGGVDSSLVAVLAVDALGRNNVVGVLMPSRFTSEQSTGDAAELARRLGIEYRIISIETIFASYLESLKEHFKDKPFDVSEENIQARIRGNILMALSNKFGYLVLGTGNKSELAMGYCTMYGDMVGGLAVISDVPKTMVYELAAYVNRNREIIPSAVLSKPPSAELRMNQKDEDSLPPYPILDPIIKAYVEDRKGVEEIMAMGHERSFVESIIRRIDNNEYKRQQAPPGLKVTSKAFGYGWRMPIAKGM
jgi:NAD+ synthase (glutamine-hydrolysing)